MTPEAPPDSTHTLILDAAQRLLERGEALNLTAVAAEAGIARAVVYRRFAGKEALSQALIAAGRMESDPPGAPDTRARILDALKDVLNQKGVAATTLEEVAKAAGVGVVTIYRRFRDRKGLLQAYVMERTPRRLATISDALLSDRDGALRLLALETIRFTREHPGLVAMLYTPDAETAALLGEVREGSLSVRELTHRIVSTWFPDETERAVAAFTGLNMAMAWMGRGTPEADSAYAVEVFLHGVPGGLEPARGSAV